MVSGQKTLHAIDTAIVRARNDLSKASILPAKISGQLVALRREESLALSKISRLRLDLIAAGEDEQKLGSVDRQAAKLLAAHERSERRLAIKAEQIEDKILELEAQRRAQEKAVTAAITAYDKKAAACQKKLLTDPDYTTLISKADNFDAMSERAEAKLVVAREDEQDKGAPYREDGFFTYLQNRSYGQKDAKGWALTKMLDGWIARLCNYQSAAINYRRLQAIPARLETHLERLQDQADEAREHLQKREQDMLISQGVEKARQDSLKAQSQLEKIDAKIAAQEDKHLAVRNEQAALTAGQSGPYAEAIKLLSRALATKDRPGLNVLAAQTASPDDDRAVAILSDLRKQSFELEQDQNQASKLLKKQQTSLKELENVRRKFKKNRYDTPFSQFPNADLISALLGQALIGALSGDDLWNQIRRAQRTVSRSTNNDFGGIDWGEAMRLPRGNNRSGGRSNRQGRSSSRRSTSRGSSRNMSKISFPKSARRSGGFKTGGGF